MVVTEYKMGRPSDADLLLQGFQRMSQEAAELWVPARVQAVDAGALSAIRFLRDYVAANVPVLIRGGCRHWPAMSRWSPSYLVARSGDSPITVALTPDGRGDRIVDGRFVEPFEQTTTMAALLDQLRTRDGPVPYAQKQCDSLRGEHAALLDDVVEPEIGRLAFGADPDAINLWIGDERAISATHADPYENLYGVVAGCKQFTLLPPTDLPYLYRRRCPRGRYVPGAEGRLVIDDQHDLDPVPWIAVDPDDPDLERFPLFAHATPLKVDVEAGDLLYLPAFWYHQVRQKPGPHGATIAVNFWYDVRFDARFTWLKFQEEVLESYSSQNWAVRDIYLLDMTMLYTDETEIDLS